MLMQRKSGFRPSGQHNQSIFSPNLSKPILCLRFGNLARWIKKYREEEKKRYLSHDEQMRLGSALGDALERGQETEYVVAAISLLMLTGCRLGKILTLKWEYVTPHHLELPDSSRNHTDRHSNKPRHRAQGALMSHYGASA
jgi:integrase